MASRFSSKFLCFVALALYISSVGSVPQSSLAVILGSTPSTPGASASSQTLATPGAPATGGPSTSSAAPNSTQSSSGVTPAQSSGIGLSNPSGTTGCFAYLNSKDGCAFSTKTNNCRPKVTTAKVQQFALSDASSSSITAGTNGSASVPTAPSSGALPGSAAPKLSRRQGGLGVMVPGGKSATAGTLNSTLPTAGGAPANASAPTSASASALTPPSSGGNATLGANPSQSASSANEGICGKYDSDTELGVCLYSGTDISGVDRKASGWLSTSATENCKKEVVFQRTGSNLPPIVAKVVDGCSFDTSVLPSGCSQIYLTKKAFMALNPNQEEISTGILSDSVTWDFNSKSNPANAAV